MASETLTIIDNRTGKKYEIPIRNGAIKATDLFQIRVGEDDGLVSYDPGFMNTASCQSKITYIDGDKGILRYRGYPIEQLAEKRDGGTGATAEVQHRMRADAALLQPAREPGDALACEVFLALPRHPQPSSERSIVGGSVFVEIHGAVPHRLCMPRMLTKKLDNTVWKPRAVSVTPGMTRRMVCA